MKQLKERKVPMRRCVATNEQFPKSEMIRIVRTPENEVIVDLTGKVRGHGVYLSKNAQAIKLAKQKKLLSRALEVEVPDSIFETLLDIVK